MIITKILAQNNSFGLKLGSTLETHIKHTAGILNKVAQNGRVLSYMIDNHSYNINFIREICPNKTIELTHEDWINKVREYDIYDENGTRKASIRTVNDDLYYNKLVDKLKEFQRRKFI